MKRSTWILIITGVACSVIGVVCMIAAAAKLADMGYKYSDGKTFTFDADTFPWGQNYNDSGDKVNVNLPFIDVQVDGDKVDVNLPGIDVNVDDNTGKVNVKIGDETDATTSTDAAEGSDATETTAP